MKCIDTESGETIAYAQWTLPLPLWEKVRAEHGGGMQAEVDEMMREQFQREHAASCTEDGEPKGMRMEVVQHCTPDMEEARKVAFPGEGEDFISESVCFCGPSSASLMYILCVVLDQVKTLPSQQRRGAGSFLTQWGVDLAKREWLKICLEATSFGLRLYEKHGFTSRAAVHHDVSQFGGPSRYTHTLMVKNPEQ